VKWLGLKAELDRKRVEAAAREQEKERWRAQWPGSRTSRPDAAEKSVEIEAKAKRSNG